MIFGLIRSVWIDIKSVGVGDPAIFIAVVRIIDTCSDPTRCSVMVDRYVFGTIWRDRYRDDIGQVFEIIGILFKTQFGIIRNFYREIAVIFDRYAPSIPNKTAPRVWRHGQISRR